jgi:hypothetical protein
MVLWRVFHDDVMHSLEDVAPLRMSIGLLDDLAYLRMPSSTSWTLDIAEITLDVAHLARCVTGGKEAHILDIAPPKDVRVLMDVVTLVRDGIPLWRDDGAFLMHDVGIFTLDVAHLEGDVMLGLMLLCNDPT